MSHTVKRTVLIADDEVTGRLLLKAALEKAGYQVVAVASGELAMQEFHARHFDLVMLDVDMPGLDGYETCALLRQQAGRDLPIVMVTGMDDGVSIERAYDAGATDFISKPINWGLIGHRVRYLLRGHQLVQDLHKANARSRAILNALPDTLLQFDADGRILDFHERDSRMLPDFPRTPGRALAEYLPEEVASRLVTAAGHVLNSDVPGIVEYGIDSPAGEQRHFEARLVAVPERQTLCLIRDVTERKASETKIYRLAYFDSLTELPNRQLFAERLEREIARARHFNQLLAVLFLDLDKFKMINDSLGHGAGDSLLCRVAERLRHGVRPADMVARGEEGQRGEVFEIARLGGDEFTMLIPDLPHVDAANAVARRINDLMRRPFLLEGRSVTLTTSVGIALFPNDGDDAATLLKHADTAMYHAKQRGRNNCQFYQETLTRDALRRLTLDGDMRLAIERDEFTLAYQPQFDLASGTMAAVEALIRWHHPTQGLIPPAEFVSVAEDTGFIMAIGEWVLRKACTDAARWLRAGTPLEVGVNLSAVQLRDAGLAAKVRDLLEDLSLDPKWLTLEVTESTVMEDTAMTLRTLQALRGMGVTLALDDFGTGYSSLSYLRRLPLHTVKIDRSFVRDLPDDQESLAIVRAIVSIAANLGFAITAEGVETAAQVQLLRELGCARLQGYHLGKPMPAVDIDRILRTGRAA